MTSSIVWLYGLSCILLLAAAFYVLRRQPRVWLRRYFALGCLAIVFWLVTLLTFYQLSDPSVILFTGRLNFASGLFIALFAYWFVRELTGEQIRSRDWTLAATILFSLITIITPSVDRAEYIAGDVHITRFGPLFSLYAIVIVGLLSAAVWQILKHARTARWQLQKQLSVIGLGMFVSVAIVITTNVVLPFGFHIFTFQQIGALSILFFVAAIAYAITFQRLFDVRLVIRKTVVLAALIALVQYVYSGSITFLVEILPTARTSPLVQQSINLATVVFIAASFDPVQHWLERQIDRVFFRRRKHIRLVRARS